MTRLERTIIQLLSEKERVVNQEMTIQETKAADNQRTQQYVQEFDSIYQSIKSVGQMETTFVKWANQHEMDDARKEIIDGAGFYQHLLRTTRSAYQTFREEGYERQTAFDKATSDLTKWIEKAYHEKGEGVIYLNYSPEFLHRLRRYERD